MHKKIIKLILILICLTNLLSCSDKKEFPEPYELFFKKDSIHIICKITHYSKSKKKYYGAIAINNVSSSEYEFFYHNLLLQQNNYIEGILPEVLVTKIVSIKPNNVYTNALMIDNKFSLKKPLQIIIQKDLLHTDIFKQINDI